MRKLNIILEIENDIKENCDNYHIKEDYYNDDPAIGYGESFCYEEEILQEEE